MNGRERELAAITRKPTDRVPIDTLVIENLDKVAAAMGLSPDAALDDLGIDGRCVAAYRYSGKVRPPENGTTFAEWGTPGGELHERREYPLANAASVQDVERYPWWPDPARYNFDFAATQAKAFNERYAVRGPYWKPLLCQLFDLMGMEETLVKMTLEEAIFGAALSHVFDHTQEYCRNLRKACGDTMPIFYLGDDFASQRGMLIAPDVWRRWLKPLYASLFAEAKANGQLVWFHSCGDITPVLGDLIDIGMDVWETVQLHALPMSPRQLKRDYGHRVTFFGAINTQRLPFASAEEIRAEVLEVIEVLGDGGGYICGPDHHVKPDVPVENVLALFRTAKEFRFPHA